MFLLFDALVSVTLEKRGNAFFEKKGEGGGGQTKIVLTKRQCTLVRLADKSCNVPLSITRRDAFSLYTSFEKKRKKTLEFKNSLFYQIAYFYLFPFPPLFSLFLLPPRVFIRIALVLYSNAISFLRPRIKRFFFLSFFFTFSLVSMQPARVQVQPGALCLRKKKVEEHFYPDFIKQTADQ